MAGNNRPSVFRPVRCRLEGSCILVACRVRTLLNRRDTSSRCSVWQRWICGRAAISNHLRSAAHSSGKQTNELCAPPLLLSEATCAQAHCDRSGVLFCKHNTCMTIQPSQRCGENATCTTIPPSTLSPQWAVSRTLPDEMTQARTHRCPRSMSLQVSCLAASVPGHACWPPAVLDCKQILCLPE
jgi:hypothetical protein